MCRKTRQSARAVLVAEQHVLMMRCKGDTKTASSDAVGEYWFTPGGGVEDGEPLEVALRREIAEEHALQHVTVGPKVAVTQVVLQRYGQEVHCTDHYFLCVSATTALDHSGMLADERETLGASEWVPVSNDTWWRTEDVRPRSVADWVLSQHHLLRTLDAATLADVRWGSPVAWPD